MSNKLKILITGASGLVGSSLLRNNFIANQNLYTPSSSELDLTDHAGVKKYFNKKKFDFVIHAAGIVGGIQANINNQCLFLKKNLDMGMNIISVAKEKNIKNLINISSSCIYPKNISKPIKEDMLMSSFLEPTNEGYALAKIIVLKYCYFISQQFNLNYKSVIPCNIYGPGDTYDEVHSHLVPAIILKLHNATINNLPYVEIWGDGNAKREFMFSDDLAKFIEYALKSFKKVPDLINVGVTKDYKIKEYYYKIAKIIGYKGQFVFDKSKPVGMKRKKVSTTKLNNIGWKNTLNLEDGLSITYRSFLKDINEKKL
jgi:nucleoside-diphosphate-sugar epimerase